jgi:hypothetical protein
LGTAQLAFTSPLICVGHRVFLVFQWEEGELLDRFSGLLGMEPYIVICAPMLTQNSISFFLKVWWQDVTFLFILIFYNIHTFIQSQYIHPSPFAEASLHFFIANVLSGENFPVVPSRESNSGLPYCKPNALTTEPRRTIKNSISTISRYASLL